MVSFMQSEKFSKFCVFSSKSVTSVHNLDVLLQLSVFILLITGLIIDILHIENVNLKNDE